MRIAKYKENLLNEFESRIDNWTYGDFERRLGEMKKRTSYHDAKNIINEAHKIGIWPKTVKRYLMTNFKIHGNVSSEFNNTFNEVVQVMTKGEKKILGFS